MTNPARILIVEDTAADAELAQREISKAIKNCQFLRVTTQSDFLNALETFNPDVILSDFSMPHFNGMKALELALKHSPLTPLIIWTGSLSEDVAVECMRAGANNYIIKDDIKRLGPAVLHALEERRLLVDQKDAEEKLRSSENRYRALFENTPVAIWEEDFSAVKNYLDALKQQGITDFRAYFASNPQELIYCTNLIRVSDVNNAAVSLYEATNKEELLESTRESLSKGEQENNLEDFIAITDGRTSNAWEGADETVTGKPIEISLTWSVVPGYEEDYSKVIVTTVDITERKQANKQLRASEERFRQLAGNIQEVFWMTDAQTNEELYISPAYEKIWGRSVEELLRNSNIFLKSILPEDRPKVQKDLQAQRNGEATETEYRILRPDGSVRWIWDRAFPIFDDSGKVVRLAGIAVDITERQQAEEALHQSQEGYRLLITAAPVGVVVHVDGKMVFANETAARIVKANSFHDLIGLPVMDFVHPDERLQTIEILKRMLKGEQNLYPREEKFICLDGSVVNVEVSATAIKYMGKPAVQVVVQDITERKRAEKDIQRHLAELEALYENGLAVGQLLEPGEIGERIINTFNRHLSWHHVTIRLLKGDSDELELVAYSLPDLKEAERQRVEQNFIKQISKVGQGMSGWVIQIGKSVRTGNVHAYPQYVEVYKGIQSGLYMPLTLGKFVIGVISIESEEADAFSMQDERLLATLANQAAVAFENARLYQSIQQELIERRRMEKELRTSETHYRELSDSITDIFFELDQNMLYTHWNKASEVFTGVAEKDAIGKTMHDIFGDSEEQKRIGSIYKNVLNTHTPTTFETVFVLNNEKNSFEVNAYPSTRGVAVVAKNITERKRLEWLQQKRFELMEFSAHNTLYDLMRKTMDEICELTASEIGFFHLMEDDQNAISMQVCSTHTLKIFNLPEDERKHSSVDQAGVWAEAVRQRRAIIHNGFESVKNQKGMPEEHIRISREMVIPVIRNEKILAVIGVANKMKDYILLDLEMTSRLADYAWDITERKRMQAALADERNQLVQRVEERTAEIVKANLNLARALRVKDEFLANMSHELRTPLNAILGLSESLIEQIAGPLNEKQNKYITTISESGHHLLSLINDILDLAKIEAGQIALEFNRVDVNSVCQASLRMVKQLAQKKSQEIVLQIDQNIGLIWADERRLKQMIVNLLSNAVKFTPEHGTLGLDIDLYRDLNRVEISVWDKGIGISKDDLARLFQPFVQLDSGLARETTGTGLGLVLVSQMARLHGGSVSVASEPGQGSRFTIVLPWEPAVAQDSITRLRNTGTLRLMDNGLGNKKKILLIDDTIEVIMVIVDYLEMAGYEVTTARDGMEGIEKARLIQPDLILMDVQMPGLDGIEATKKLRADPHFKDVPIVALTALAMPNDRERCIEAGMNDYMSKPVNLRALVNIIQKCLSAG